MRAPYALSMMVAMGSFATGKELKIELISRTDNDKLNEKISDLLAQCVSDCMSL
jgi:hypothetical protein